MCGSEAGVGRKIWVFWPWDDLFNTGLLRADGMYLSERRKRVLAQEQQSSWTELGMGKRKIPDLPMMSNAMGCEILRK